MITRIFTGLLTEIWTVFQEASFYILLGMFVAGLIEMFLNEEVIARHMGKRDLKSVLWAALLGVPLPLCSCGVLPAAVSLKNKGAAKGATLSFLISTPESGIDSIVLSFALLDPIMAFFRPLAAFTTAVLAGTAENLFGVAEAEKPSKSKRTPACACCHTGDKKAKQGLIEKFKAGMEYAFVEMLGDIGKWLVFGIVAAGIISYSFPQSFIERYFGSGWLSMLLMLIVGIPMYICASASTPIAAALIAKGMSPGAALVFLLAGPATNAAGIAVIAKLMGRRTVAIYLATISVSALAMGALLNQVYTFAGINPRAIIGRAGEMTPEWLGMISAVVLMALTLNAARRTRNHPRCDA
ncbi:MAG: hypothetical protein A2270_10800 [Elusimicrobia bacterium RIFOXYA12_FULL_51_18]|nr:MAG: hypothetical protein A2270_10800 [Elusimicrobia bacterium RIFOXYA12_FULL_51_18]OGS29447.1 MAG: hypothetical protein A2218_00390 [Elusimicrobia bacterium RIFOXYA2_FULL_53_38]